MRWGTSIQQMRGAALPEVMLALWLIGIAALSAIHLQLWIAHTQQSVLWRWHAIRLADTAAEALRGNYPLSRIKADWGKRAAALLPAGGVRITDKHSEIRLITLHWNEPTQWFHWTHHPTPDCPQSGTIGITRCVSIAIAK